MEHATFVNHCGAKLITPEELQKVPCPEPEGIWRPVPHMEIVDTVTRKAVEYGLEVTGTELSVDKNGRRMFGVMRIQQHVVVSDSEFGFAVGFRNSHDKSLAFRIVLGTQVFVCDNLCMHGGLFDESRIHTINIDPGAIVQRAFESFEVSAQMVQTRYDRLREITVEHRAGAKLLFEAAQMKALQKSRLLEAYTDWEKSFDEDPSVEIDHPGTAWAFQQAVTAQWRGASRLALETRSQRLDELLDNHFLLDTPAIAAGV